MPGTARTLPDPLNAYQLANRANCACPDALDSPGAKFLESVQDGVREAIDDAPDAQDAADLDYNGRLHEIADAAPDVYTYTRWQEFVDLAAWQEDLDEIGGTPDDMTDAAGVCLYLIAARLAHALADEILIDMRDAQDNADEDADS